MLLRIVVVCRIQLIGLVIVSSLPILHFAKGGAGLVADRLLVRAGLGAACARLASRRASHGFLPTITYRLRCS